MSLFYIFYEKPQFFVAALLALNSAGKHQTSLLSLEPADVYYACPQVYL